MNDIRNWSSLAIMKLFTTRKHNTVEWPKMHNLPNGIYTFFLVTPPYFYIWFSALCASSLVQIYVTIGLDISVSETESYVIIVLGIFDLENYTWPLPRNDPEARQREWADTPNLLEKTKSTFKCIAKIHSLECKSNFIVTILSLFYINALRMSDSFADVGPIVISLYVTCKIPLVNK